MAKNEADLAQYFEADASDEAVYGGKLLTYWLVQTIDGRDYVIMEW